MNKKYLEMYIMVFYIINGHIKAEVVRKKNKMRIVKS
jgi:hypothetical protein